MKRGVFFDIDGTLIKGQIIFDFPRFLHRAGLFDERRLLEIAGIAAEYEVKFLSYRDAGKRILKIYAEALAGADAALIAKKSCEFAREHIKKKYTYTDELVDFLGRRTVLVALSASPVEPVVALKKYIPFREVYGTELEVKEGMYTGKVRRNMLDVNSKRDAMVEALKKLKLEREKSVAFGDSDADAEYLSVAGYPFALNPNRHLKGIALENGWPVFGENDDVAGNVKRMAFSKVI